jgi:type IV pilus assembly protein PilW
MARSRSGGFSLTELMIALTLGLLLLAAFLAVLDRSRRAAGTNENLAQLQDSARVAFDALALDLEHAGFFGLAGLEDASLARLGVPLLTGDALRQPSPAAPVVAAEGLPDGSHDCGVNFVVDLQTPVEAASAWPPSGSAVDCDPTGSAGGARSGSDALVVRRASFGTTAPRAGRVQLYSHRDAHGALTVFADGVAPGPLDAGAEVRDLEVRSYYIANDSVGRRGLPALRVKALTESGGRAQFRDEEIMPGVEDMQVELGVRDGAASRALLTFLPAGSPELRARRIVAARLWLRVRAPAKESDPGAGELRMLLERTVTLRNLPLP